MDVGTAEPSGVARDDGSDEAFAACSAAAMSASTFIAKPNEISRPAGQISQAGCGSNPSKTPKSKAPGAAVGAALPGGSLDAGLAVTAGAAIGPTGRRPHGLMTATRIPTRITVTIFPLLPFSGEDGPGT